MSDTSTPPTTTAESDVVAQLETALLSRTVTAQATGLLAARFGVDTDQAWRLLREVSNRSNQKLAKVAQLVVDLHNQADLTTEETRVASAVAAVFDVAVSRAGPPSSPSPQSPPPSAAAP